MGCSASKPADPTAFQKDRRAALQKASTEKVSEESLQKYNETHSAKSRQEGKVGLRVQPGYSSGASSYSGSDIDESDAAATPNRSRHSDILALQNLREEMVAEGDITKTVVRIETPFGKPIEEIYSGVHDGPVLGSGVSGIVRLVTHRATGINYAVKCLDIGLIDSTEGLRQLRNEIFIMCQLDHPNIVRIEEVYESTNEIYIVQELCTGGDLFDRLDEQPEYHYTEAQCARLVKQMLSSVRYLHSKGIVHRDLKLENFLFSSNKPESELKMIDFGLSKHFITGEALHDRVGTPYTVAPEIIHGHYNEKSDVWSIGVITYLLLSGETPFGGLDGENMLLVKENIIRAKVLFKPEEIWESVSSDGKAFVKRLLNPDSSKRPTAKDAQKDRWIQVWAKKDVKSGNKLDKRTITALMDFKEQSDMQKLLSEVLSFTLLPEQIVDLRDEFEKMDPDGDGEISLTALKKVLMDSAADGSLGALTEVEIESLFDAISVRKGEQTIRWHEFLAAGLSNAKVDDRNLRLAFDRLDAERKGYITFEDLQDLLGGGNVDNPELEKIWKDSLNECKARLNRINFEDFKLLMKGQPKDAAAMLASSSSLGSAANIVGSQKPLGDIPEDKVDGDGTKTLEELESDPRLSYSKKRSHSHQEVKTMWTDQDISYDPLSFRDSTRAISLGDDKVISNEQRASPLLQNRALYRKHREMRIAVLDASKKFDKKRNDRQNGSQASLIMKRGARPPVELEDDHNRKMFEAAAKRCGRARRTRNKTVSDVTGMIIQSQA